MAASPSSYVEHQNQTQFHTWFCYQYPKYINNFNSSLVGVRLPIQAAVRAKAVGVRKGWPDIQIMIPNAFYNGLFIEMKSIIDGKRGVVKPEQKAVHAALTEQGYLVRICYSSTEAEQVFKEYVRYVIPKQPHPEQAD